MKALIKGAMTTVGFVLIIAAVVAILLSTNFGAFAGRQFEERIVSLFGVSGSVQKVRLAQARLGIELIGVRVHNPAAFKDGEAIECDSVLIVPDLKTIFSETTVINEIILSGLDVHLRYEANQGTNLGNLSKEAARIGDKQQTDGLIKHKFQVKELRCAGGIFTLSSNVAANIPLSLHIDPFTLDKFGDKPVSSAKLTSIILRGLVTQAVTIKGLLRPVTDALRAESQ